jgi:gamma-glutamyltranspeptidase/glutathione hydrolase
LRRPGAHIQIRHRQAIPGGNTMNGKRPRIASVHGVVAAAHPLAAQAGAQVLREGGNAFDAIAATAAALNVAEPFMSGLAGMGQATAYVAKEKRVRTLDFVTRVPFELPIERFARREDLARGPLACGTPGNLAGWCELVRAHGRKQLKDVFAPAIAIARDGMVLTEFGEYKFMEAAADLPKYKAFYGDWNRTYAFGKGAVKAGDVLRQPDLARTYEAIAAEGPDHLYRGELGKALIRHVRKLGGCLTHRDLEAVRPQWLDPIVAEYRGMAIHTLPPPCEGFQYLLTLRILDGFDVARLERNGVDHLDLVWRAIRVAAGVRIAHNNPDPRKLKEMLSERFVAKLRKRVADGKPVDGPTEQWIEARPIDERKEHTTSFSAADREGNVVCVTQSLGATFGCGVVVPGTGVCLNNFLYWGEVNPKGTNYMRPGGPLALPTAPTIGTRDGRPVLALGTPGSYGICQTQTQTMVQLVDYGLQIQDAIEAPRARLWDGRRVQVEGRVRPEVVEALNARGHAAESYVPWTMTVGGMHGIVIDPRSGAMTGGCDPRRDGYVATA